MRQFAIGITLASSTLCGIAGPARADERAATQPTTPATRPAEGPLPYRGAIDRFANALGDGRINDAAGCLGVDVGSARHDEVQRKLSTLYGVSGKYLANEVVAVSALSPSLQRVQFLAHFEKGVILFQFTVWHRPGDPADQWRVMQFSVHTDIDDMFKDRPLAPFHEQAHAAVKPDADFR